MVAPRVANMERKNTHHWYKGNVAYQLTPDSINPRGGVKVTSEVKTNAVGVNSTSKVLPTAEKGSKP